jgi:RNA-binding protein
MKKNISNDLRKELKRKAYSLKPVIMIGQNGLTDAVMNEIDVALNAHELIKIRSKGLDKSDRKQQCLIIEDKLNANIIQQIGFVAVLYRRSLDVNSIC